MQISEIQAFVAICEQGSFREAAQRLHLTQPAVSKRIASLESQLDYQLLNRTGRSISLTEAGQTFLPHARRLLAEMEDSQRALDSLSERVDGRLGLALSHHVGLHRIPPVLETFIQRYPQVELDIEFLDSERACQAIANGRLELAVMTLPEPAVAGLEQRLVWTDPMRLFVAPGHPLAQAAVLEPAALAGVPALLPERNTYTYAIVAEALAGHGVSPDIRMTSNYLETLKMLAAVGLGWTALPLSMADDSLRALSVPGLAMTRELGSVRHPGRSLSNAARALLALLHPED